MEESTCTGIWVYPTRARVPVVSRASVAVDTNNSSTTHVAVAASIINSTSTAVAALSET